MTAACKHVTCNSLSKATSLCISLARQPACVPAWTGRQWPVPPPPSHTLHELASVHTSQPRPAHPALQSHAWLVALTVTLALRTASHVRACYGRCSTSTHGAGTSDPRRLALQDRIHSTCRKSEQVMCDIEQRAGDSGGGAASRAWRTFHCPPPILVLPSRPELTWASAAGTHMARPESSTQTAPPRMIERILLLRPEEEVRRMHQPSTQTRGI